MKGGPKMKPTKGKVLQFRPRRKQQKPRPQPPLPPANLMALAV